MNDEVVHKAFDFAGDLASAAASRLGGPWSMAATGIAAVLKAAALALRDQGKGVDEIVRAIRMPKPLDTSWRDDIDKSVREKPERG